MTVAKHVTRGLALGCLALSLTLVTASAQNFENYHILQNGTDVFYTNIGAGSITGGTTTLYNAPSDGIGTWIPGEELRGPTKAALLGDYAYGIRGFREFVCFLGAPPFNPQTGTNVIRFPLGLMIELDGAVWHGNRPGVFLAPLDPACLGAPLGTAFTGSATWVPYGGTKLSTTALLGSASWVLAGLPTGVTGSAGFPSSLAASVGVLIPNEGLTVPSSSPSAGTATIFAQWSAALDTGNTGQTCWGIQFSFVTSGGLPTSAWLPDDITGLWHWLFFSPDGSQGYGWSVDEMALFQTNSVWMVSDIANGKFTIPFIAGTDYSLLLVAMHVTTGLTLDPLALSGPGPYTFQTENVVGSPNLGFDAGRGGRTLSLGAGLGTGVFNTDGLTNQDSANPTTNPFWGAHTLGFMSWDSNGAGPGSSRLTLISFDWDGLVGLDPGLAFDAEFPAGSGSRLPAPIYASAPPAYFQGLTNSLIPVFGHTAAIAPLNGWPDPDGFSVGAFGVPPIAGASLQFFLPPLPVCFPGLPLGLAYGSIDSVFTNQGITATSGLRETFLFD